MDLVRNILIAIERGDAQYADGDACEVMQHIEMMERAGLIYGHGRNLWGMTWEGFNLLDAIRKDSVWAKAKVVLMKQGESWTFDLLKRWVTNYVSQQIGLH
jgi:Hypothetical protein (DUF2513)